MFGDFETVTVRRGDPEVERRSQMWLLNCELCLDAVGLAWNLDGEVVSRCVECGTREQEERASAD